jgi:hypothetical protein
MTTWIYLDDQDCYEMRQSDIQFIVWCISGSWLWRIYQRGFFSKAEITNSYLEFQIAANRCPNTRRKASYTTAQGAQRAAVAWFRRHEAGNAQTTT